MYYIIREYYKVKAFNGTRVTSKICQTYGNSVQYTQNGEEYDCYNTSTKHPAIQNNDGCKLVSYDGWDVKDIIAFSDTKIPKSKFKDLELKYKSNKKYTIFKK